MAKPKPKPAPKTYDWFMDPKGITCYESTKSMCTVLLTPATVLTAFHDERLSQATKQINSILEKTREANKDGSKCLSILNTPKGLFLAWTKEGMGSSENDNEDELCKRLGI